MSEIDIDQDNAEEAIEVSRTSSEDMLENNPLPEDNDTPASVAHGVGGISLPVDHPRNDTAMDQHELYDEGMSELSEYDEQSRDIADLDDEV